MNVNYKLIIIYKQLTYYSYLLRRIMIQIFKCLYFIILIPSYDLRNYIKHKIFDLLLKLISKN